MNRREFNYKSLFLGAGLMFGSSKMLWAKDYVSVEQAMQIIWPDLEMQAFEITLNKQQMDSIKKASETRVRNNIVKGFKSKTGEWLILDQVIGKHEYIDLAVGINLKGEVQGIEVLKYVESYGYEIMNPKWRAQFYNKSAEPILKLDHQIKNISGATMSCRHVTDGVNRLTQTWKQVLQHS
jgi:Na+-translocating ferredoxin:NAD+ oxidoreductase RnfG subunit